MITLLLTAVLGSHIVQPHLMRLADTRHACICCDQTPRSIVVVIDGTPGWLGQAANRAFYDLKAQLNCSHLLQITRFDADPTLRSDYVPNGTNHDLIVVRPRTPLIDAIETGIAQLMDVRGPRILIVIAHKESYPRSVSIYLLTLAQQSETEVHTVYLVSNRGRSIVSGRRARWVARKALWIPDKLGMRGRGNSTRGTSRLLMEMTNGTGGTTCVSQNKHSQTACVSAIAAAIARSSRR